MIVIFKSKAFYQGWPDEDSDPNHPPLGKDLAVSIRQTIMTQGANNPSAIVEAEGGWEFEASIDGEKIVLFTHWVPIDDPPEDYWVIQTRGRASLADSIWGISVENEGDQNRVAKFLKSAVEAIPDTSDVRWLSDEQFKAIY